MAKKKPAATSPSVDAAADVDKMFVPMDSISPNPANTQQHPASQIAFLVARIRQFGQYAPLQVASDNVILKGNGTYQAMQQAGLTEAWIERQPFASTSPQGVAFSIGDNRASQLGETDEDLVAMQFDALPAEFQEFTGFEAADFEEEDEEDEYGGGGLETVEASFQVIVTLENESEQQELFERLKTEGKKCKVVTL
ncbi:ParB N-terminal domain-containing protein [Roseimaritima ulvae]|uniref:ParB/Sulfiredoxin domain-containing protein n=1 Tax=Roseimaritima ulvae TaxID=980254 RepID=A0A5B9QTK8_9BACT|nr:hypothetical protein [Roseimaritima ulvae]QEG40416.1 hypothetical protein UC8_24280 [Roseimaritima ulvae]